MAYETKPMTGSAFPNDDGSGKSAYSGTIKLDDGREMWINMYNNETKNGRPYFGIKLKEKMSGGSSAPKSQPVQIDNVSDAINDEVPF